VFYLLLLVCKCAEVLLSLRACNRSLIIIP